MDKEMKALLYYSVLKLFCAFYGYFEDSDICVF